MRLPHIWLLSVMVAGPVPMVSPAQAQEKPTTTEESVRKRREAQFREWDTNKDGVLEPSEFHGHPGNFRAMDCNHDGVLSLEEFVNRYHCDEAATQAPPEAAVIHTAPTPRPTAVPSVAAPTPRPTATPPVGLTGSALQQFRRLARDLDGAVLRMLDRAEARPDDYADGGRFLSDLRTFSDEAEDLHFRSMEANVAADQVRPLVGHLLQDAHQTDKAMRQARVPPQLWDEWTRARGMLNRLARLVG